MQLKLSELNNPDALIGKTILYVLRENFVFIREGIILSYAEGYDFARIGDGSSPESYTWQFSVNITVLSILRDKR